LYCFRYVRGVRLKYWRNAETYKFQRQKVAVDLSHFQNLERIARENKAAVILEDDVGFEKRDDKDSWYRDLLKALQELPQVGQADCRAVNLTECCLCADCHQSDSTLLCSGAATGYVC
jgi:hypothetical protein